jgi:hypothetical protein
MTREQFIAHLMDYYDEMGLDSVDDCTLQHFYDPESQTLQVHVLTQDELDSLAGYSDSECGRCVHVGCPDMGKTSGPCDAFIDKEESW